MMFAVFEKKGSLAGQRRKRRMNSVVNQMMQPISMYSRMG